MSAIEDGAMQNRYWAAVAAILGCKASRVKMQDGQLAQNAAELARLRERNASLEAQLEAFRVAAKAIEHEPPFAGRVKISLRQFDALMSALRMEGEKDGVE